VRSGRVQDLPDLYSLSPDDVRQALGRSAGRAAEQLVAAIAASRQAELWRFIHGLGIPGVGAAGARELAQRYQSLDALLERASTGGGGADAPRAPQAAGPGAAERALAEYLKEPRHVATLRGLLAQGLQPAAPTAAAVRVSATAGSVAGVAGKTVVLTGTLPTLTRAEATKLIEAAGGKVAGNVSRSTQLVIAGVEPGAKLDQARALGITIVDEAGLRRMLDPPAGAAEMAGK
jgi:DNA ligase (NAD+)